MSLRRQYVPAALWNGTLNIFSLNGIDALTSCTEKNLEAVWKEVIDKLAGH